MTAINLSSKWERTLCITIIIIIIILTARGIECRCSLLANKELHNNFVEF